MDAKEFDFHKHNRTYARASLTKFCNALFSKIGSFDLKQCRNAIADLKAHQAKLERLETLVSQGAWVHISEQTKLDEEFSKFEEYETKIMTHVRLVEDQIEFLQGLSAPPASGGGSSPGLSDVHRIGQQVKLPQLPLPEFSNKEGESLEKFLTNFESILGKFTCTEYEKYVFLTGQLKDEALTLIKSL